jgi:hypothetical protein
MQQRIDQDREDEVPFRRSVQVDKNGYILGLHEPSTNRESHGIRLLEAEGYNKLDFEAGWFETF